jgi:adenylosuccinate lyase
VIARYTPKEIGAVWTDQVKFQTWLDVELAVIEARSQLGVYSPDVGERIRSQASFEVEDINELDRQIEHDLLAFVEVVRWSLPPELRWYVHDGLTSYDTEVPALALQFQKAGAILDNDLDALITSFRRKAGEHLYTYCMGVTHGQDAEPTTFGWRLCGYLDMLQQGRVNLTSALEQIKMVKCSGAVGNWATISPELEECVCQLLGLRLRPAATQIVSRDVFARFLAEVAIIGGCLEKIATDLRILATSAYREVQEPRKPKQKGSSAMPHKINTILLERLCGMAIMLRGYAAMGQELIRTWLERDIAHSCVERIAFADATIILDYMLQKMNWIVENLIVHRSEMAQGIQRSLGCWASEHVKLLLCRKGIDPEDVYLFIQGCAFNAFDEHRLFRDVLWESVVPSIGKTLSEVIEAAELDSCFDFKQQLSSLPATAIKRMGLDPTQAMSPNI